MNIIKSNIQLCFIIIGAMMIARSAAAPLLPTENPELEGSVQQASGSGELDSENAAAAAVAEEAGTTAAPDYDCTEASSNDYLSTHTGNLIRGVRTITAYSEYANIEWDRRGGDHLLCRSNIRVRNALEFQPELGSYSHQNLANTAAIFEAYIEIATLALEQEANVTVQEHLTIIHDILVAVVEDYKKVLSPFYCDCEAGETTSCFSTPELAFDLIPDCNPSAFIFFNFYSREALFARREARSWSSQENIEPVIVSQSQWIQTHIDSTSPAMTLADAK